MRLFKINPAVQLVCDKVSTTPWSELYKLKLYDAVQALEEHGTYAEKRALNKALRESKRLELETHYHAATKLIVSGEYTADRWGTNGRQLDSPQQAYATSTQNSIVQIQPKTAKAK